MFNGIITHLGKIYEIKKIRNNCALQILSNMNFKNNEIGSSVSCSGACLTLESFKKKYPNFISLEKH